MGDDGEDIQVCQICEEILMSKSELDDHMKEEHPPKKEEKEEKKVIPKIAEPVKRPRSSLSEEGGEKKRARSRSSSPKRPSADFMSKLVNKLDKDKDDKRRDEKKMKKHKHRDRSRSKERHGEKFKEKEKKPDDYEKFKAKMKDEFSKVSSFNDHKNGSMDDFIDDDDEDRKKMKKFREDGHKEHKVHKEKEHKEKSTVFGNREQGIVLAHDNVDGPECFKCGQVCKDNGNLKNHILSHYYQDFYRVTPDSKPFPCPECQKENRDRITMIRHFAFSHGKIFELTDVTPEQLKASGKMGQGPRPIKPKEPKERKEKKGDFINDSSDDEKEKKEKKKDWSSHFATSTDKNMEELRTKFGKHKDHKHKKEKKNKDHKKNETEEERRARKEKKRAQKEKERNHSKDGSNPLDSLLKEMTPDSRDSGDTQRNGETNPGDPKRRIAHTPAQRSEPNSPDPPAGALDPIPDPSSPKIARQEDKSDDDDDDDFGDLPVPVFAE